MSIRKFFVKKEKAAVVITTLMVMSLVVLSASVTLLVTTVDLNKSTQFYYVESQVRFASQACFEESMLKLSTNKSFTGNFGLVLNGSSCNSDVIVDPMNPDQKIVTYTGIHGENTYTKSVTVDVSTDPIMIVN